GRGRKSGRGPGGCSLVSSRVFRPAISGTVAVGRSAIAHDPRGFTHTARCWKTIVAAAGRRRPVPASQNIVSRTDFARRHTCRPGYGWVRPLPGRPFPFAAEDST